MRLWHYELISYLPNSQLLSQWRELNSIYKKQDKHILINYIYEYSEYSKCELFVYSVLVACEMEKRCFKIKTDNLEAYIQWKEFADVLSCYFHFSKGKPFKKHHNDRYLLQCFYNLQEKYDRGQKDFSEEQYEKLEKFMKKRGLIK